ncbi:MAG: hypothetical protein ABF296_07575 [Oceanococcaceae bacterium]
MMKRNILLATASTVVLAACGGGGGGGGDVAPTPTPTAAPTMAPTMPPAASVCDEAFVSCSGTVATLDGTIDKNFTLEAGFQWRMGGFVKVGSGNVEITSEAQAQAIRAAGVTLTVPAGTEVLASDADALLLVTRGSRLVANGTRANPITFASLDADFDGTSEWGGIIMQGFAPQFAPGNNGICTGGTLSYCNVAGEGGPEVAFYGGNNPADDNGILRYVRIAEGGIGVAADNEVNGLTLQGTGYNTVVEFVQVHNNLDDAFEWFGGTTNAKWIVATGTGDDSIDFDEGWKGNIQYGLVVQDQERVDTLGNDPRGIEANSSDEDFVPQTEAALANILLIGGPSHNSPNSLEPGMRLRGSVMVDIYNTGVLGFEGNCVRIDDSNTDGIDGADSFSVVSLTNVIGDCDGGFYRGSRSADSEVGTVGDQTITLDAAYAITQGVAQLPSAVAIPAVDNGSGFAFDATDYIGAVAPGTTAAQAWWAGWTLPGTIPASITR